MNALYSIVFLCLLAAVGTAQTLDLPVRNTNKRCIIVSPGAVTSGGTISITCHSAHNFAVDDRILISNVPGNRAANGIRLVKSVPTATTFTIKTLAGADIPSSGTWVNGDNAGFIGGVQLAVLSSEHTKQDIVGGYFDTSRLIKYAASVRNGLLAGVTCTGTTCVATYSQAHGLVAGNKVCIYGASTSALNCTFPTGEYTLSSVTPTTATMTISGASTGTTNNTDLTVSAFGVASHPAWASIDNTQARSGYANGAGYFRMLEALNMAHIWYINRADTTALAVAKAAINNAETAMLGGYCNTATGNCGSTYGDYSFQYIIDALEIFQLIKSELTGPEITRFGKVVLNGSADPTSCTAPTISTLTGTVSSSGVGQWTVGTLSGTGTAFSTELAVDGFILPSTDLEAFVRVRSITNDGSATVSGMFSPSGTVRYVAPWTDTKCGLVWWVKHHVGAPAAQPTEYPRNGGSSVDGVAPASNMAWGKGMMALIAGAFLNHPEAAQAAGAAASYYTLFMWPSYVGYWSGFGPNGPNYQNARTGYMSYDWLYGLKTWFSPGLDYLADATPLLRELNDIPRYLWVNDTNAPSYTPVAGLGRESGLYTWGFDASKLSIFDCTGGGRGPACPGPAWLIPSDATSPFQNFWYRDASKRAMSATGSFYAGQVFRRYDPTIVAASFDAQPTQRIFRSGDAAKCAAGGLITCPATGEIGHGGYVSRDSFTSGSGIVCDTGGGIEDRWNRFRFGDCGIVRSGRVLYGTDGYQGSAIFGTLQDAFSNIAIDGVTPVQTTIAQVYGVPNMPVQSATVVSWAGGTNNYGRSDNKFSAITTRFNVRPVGSAVTREERTFVHRKRPGKTEYFVQYDDVACSPNCTARTRHHYYIGAPDAQTISCSTGCTNLDSTRAITSAGTIGALDTQFLAPGGGLFVSAATDMSYVGGEGYTKRAETCSGSGSCSAAANYEAIAVHRIAASSAAVGGTLLAPSSSVTGVGTGDMTLLIGRRGTAANAASSVTTATQTDVIGLRLAAGTWNLKRNGSDVSGCDAVVVVDGDNTFYCEDVAAGTLLLTQVGGPPAPPTITTTSPLAGGTAGSAYSITFAATGGTAPYTWDITSGSFSACGLSLSSAGVLSGATPIAGTCVATVRVTDAAPSTASGSFSVTIAPGGGGGGGAVGTQRPAASRGGVVK